MRDSTLARIYRRAFQVMQHGSTKQKLEVMNIINLTNQFAFMPVDEIDEVSDPIHETFFEVLDSHPEILDGQIRIEEVK